MAKLNKILDCRDKAPNNVNFRSFNLYTALKPNVGVFSYTLFVGAATKFAKGKEYFASSD